MCSKIVTIKSTNSYWDNIEKVKKNNDLFNLVQDQDYFVLTTNIDHCFQKVNFDKHRLFYSQGDYGLWQCSKPYYNKTYDNQAAIKKMVANQRDMRIPSELISHCPVCGAPMSMNLRTDNTFVEDDGSHTAPDRHQGLCSLLPIRGLYSHRHRFLKPSGTRRNLIQRNQRQVTIILQGLTGKEYSFCFAF